MLRRLNALQIAGHQYDIRSLDRHVSTSSNRNTNVCRGERRSIVEPIAHKGDFSTIGPQGLKRVDLAFGQHASDHPRHAEFSSNRLRRFFLVAGYQRKFQSMCTQPIEHCNRIWFQPVHDTYHAGKLTIHRGEEDGATRARRLGGLRIQPAHIYVDVGHIAVGAHGHAAITNHPFHAHTAARLHLVGLNQRNAFIPSGRNKRVGDRVLCPTFDRCHQTEHL